MIRVCGRSCLLPKLLYLETTIDHAPEIMFLMSPLLHYFSMTRVLMATSCSLLNSIQTLSPNLVVLHLQDVEINRCLSAIRTLSHLQKIWIEQSLEESTVDTIILDISAKTVLRHFEIRSPHLKIRFPQKFLEHEPIVFPALEYVEISCDLGSITNAVNLLRNVKFPQLHTLILRLCIEEQHKLADARHWREFFELLSNITTKHFRFLKLCASGFHDYWDPLALGVSTLPKLESFALEGFEMEGPFLRYIDQEDIERVIHMWPQLTKLSLICYRLPKIEFKALIDIALGLPLLCTLELSMDARNLPELEEVPLLSHGLKSIHLSRSSVKKPKNFAQCLDILFPHLKSWHFESNVENHNDKLWREAEEMLPILQRARRDEVRRKEGS